MKDVGFVFIIVSKIQTHPEVINLQNYACSKVIFVLRYKCFRKLNTNFGYNTIVCSSMTTETSVKTFSDDNRG